MKAGTNRVSSIVNNFSVINISGTNITILMERYHNETYIIIIVIIILLNSNIIGLLMTKIPLDFHSRVVFAPMRT